MLDYRQLQALAAVLEEKSFERAAKRLFITQSAVSQRVRQLEDRLGQMLVIRRAPLRPTAAGRQLLKHYHQVTQLQSDLLCRLSAVDVGERWQRAVIGVNADSLATWFLDAVRPLLGAQNLLLELKVADQQRTHELLATGEVMGCISSSSEPLQGCQAIPLGVMAYRCFASPAFKKRYFANRPEDGSLQQAFQQAPSVEFDADDDMLPRFLETHFGFSIDAYPRHQIPSPEAYLKMLLNGHALGMVPEQMCGALLRRGRLVDLTPGCCASVPLYWHTWSLKTELHGRLIDCLTDAAQRLLAPISD